MPPVKRHVHPAPTQQDTQQHVQQEQQQAAETAASARKGPLHGWSLSRVKRRLQRALRSPYDQAIWSLAAPAVLALAADPLLGMVDTAFVGRLGQEHLVGGQLQQ